VRIPFRDRSGKLLPELLDVPELDQHVARGEVEHEGRIVRPLAVAEVVGAVPHALVLVGEDDDLRGVDVELGERRDAFPLLVEHAVVGLVERLRDVSLKALWLDAWRRCRRRAYSHRFPPVERAIATPQ
jgi:hypothetical protein